MSTKSDDIFDDVVDQRYEHRRQEMNVALRWAAVLTFGFVLVTLDVINQGLLYRFDKVVAEIERPRFTGFTKFWRPLNLSFLSLVFLNVFVGSAKIFFGRCKARENFDVCMFTDGMAYPSGHISNALVTWGLFAYIIFRYTHRAPFEGLKLYWLVALLTIAVGSASLLRNTHWFTDLLGGMFIGGAILVLVVAIDRFIPSRRQPS